MEKQSSALRELFEILGPQLRFWYRVFVVIALVVGFDHLDRKLTRQQEEREAATETAAAARVDAERRAQLVREVRWDEFLDGLDPQDASLWTALVPYAELDEHCNALPECTDGPTHKARPIIVRTPGWDNSVAYIAILGIEARTPQGHQVIPRITYYVGNQSGILWRMSTGATQAEVRTPYTDEWRPVTQSASDWMRDEVRTAFINEWRRRLTPPRAQAL